MLIQTLTALWSKMRDRGCNEALLIFRSCIAISGLGGHASGSFKSKGQPFMWLRDALPRDLPQARIFICGLDVDSVNSKSWGNITDLGTEFRDMINQLRPSKIVSGDKPQLSCSNTPQGPPRPLVLIGHSLGGLIVKEVRHPCVQVKIFGLIKIEFQGCHQYAPIQDER